MSHPGNIEARLRTLIEQAISTEKKWKELEKLTGIASSSWVDFNRRKKRATADMIEAVSVVWPQYAFWLASGISDPQHGHVAPGDYGFPKAGEEQPSSTRYFRQALAARAAAEAAMTKWLDAEFENPEVTREMVSADELLRGAHQIEGVETTVLSDSLDRVNSAAALRQHEISLYKNMPHLDHDETEAALKPIKRALTAQMGRFAKHHMEAEMEGVQRQIAQLDEQIMRRRRYLESLDKKRGADGTQ